MTGRQETFFDVAGPFAFERDAGARPNAAWWRETVNGYWEGLANAVGCYMFCIRHGEVIRPWYIGMTVNQNGFQDETFTDHKMEKYRKCLDGRRGKPLMFFFPLMLHGRDPERARFSDARASRKADIEWLEKILMGMAYARNRDIANEKDMARLRSVTVRGVMGQPRPGRHNADVTLARRALLGPPVRAATHTSDE